MRARWQTWGAALLVTLALGGCDFNKLMADGAAGLTHAAADDMEAYWDPVTAMDGTPSAIMQLEAMRSISPENPVLNVELAKAYIGYGYAVVEFDYEKLEADAQLEKADRQRHRARLIYRRARDLGLAALHETDEDFEQARGEGLEAFERHLADTYTEEEDLFPLFWTGIAWGSLINMSSDFPDIVADMPLAKAMMERVVAVAPGYGHGSALAFLGGFQCGFPEMFGGSLDKGSEYFERALELTERKAHTVQLQYARICALNARNKELYVGLLREIIQAPDQGDENRLANKIARHRAEWYLSRLGDEF